MLRVLMLLLLTQSLLSMTGQVLDNEDEDQPSSLIPFPDGGFKGTIYFVYDDAAVKKYTKAGADMKARRVYEYIHRWFQDEESLGTSVNFTLAGIGHWPIKETDLKKELREVKNIIKNISESINHEPNIVSYLSGDVRGRGRSVTGTLCATPTARATMSGMTKSDYGTARLAFHEIGHVFGMTHGGEVNLPCGIHRVVVPGAAATESDPKFTNCSRISFWKYFNKEGGRSGRFCLPLNDCYCNPEGSVAQFSCTGDYDYCTCKQGYLGPRCDQCLPFTQRVVTGRKAEVKCGCKIENARIAGRANLKVIKNVVSLEACHQLCLNNPSCLYFTYKLDLKSCLLKGVEPTRKSSVGAVTGTRLCAETAQDKTDCIEKDAVYDGYSMGSHERETPLLCLEFCLQTADCDAWVWVKDKRKCFRKGLRAGLKPEEGYITAPRNCHEIKPHNGPFKA